MKSKELNSKKVEYFKNDFKNYEAQMLEFANFIKDNNIKKMENVNNGKK